MQQIKVLQCFGGCAYGIRQQTLLAQIDFAPLPPPDWAAIDKVMLCLLEVDFLSRDAASNFEQKPFVSRMMWWSTVLQEKAGLPVFQPPIILQLSGNTNHATVISAVPYAPGQPHAAALSLRWALQTVCVLAECKPSRLHETIFAVTSRMNEALISLRAISPRNSNTLRYLQGAFEAGVPWAQIADDVYQFGWGRYSRLMNGSLTDHTSMIGTRLAGNKHASAKVLRRIGLPSPTHTFAHSADEAEIAANRLGYPVVIKPADLDGGVGVAADLKTPSQVHKSFLSASRHSQHILVEKHVTGQDYRLTVFNGQLIWAVHRQPGGVTGDGVHSVRQLTNILNANPNRRDDAASPLKRLYLDEEASELVAEAGIAFDDVPAFGHFIRLRRTANVASGGTPVAVTDRVHPDNRQLAIDVAAAFRLDLIGIDILIEDISRSWHEIGATICEVNADPQLGFTTQQHLYGEIVRALCKGAGRIPSIVIAGKARAKQISEVIETNFRKRSYSVGLASASAAKVMDRTLTNKPDNIFVSAQCLLSNSEVEVAIIVLEDASVLQTSLPIDEIDALVLLDEIDGPDFLLCLTRMLAPNAKRVFVDGEEVSCRKSIEQIAHSKIVFVPGGDRGFVGTLTAVIENALRITGEPSANS